VPPLVIDFLWFAGGIGTAAVLAAAAMLRRDRRASRQRRIAEQAGAKAGAEIANLQSRLNREAKSVRQLERQRNRLENLLHRATTALEGQRAAKSSTDALDCSADEREKSTTGPEPHDEKRSQDIDPGDPQADCGDDPVADPADRIANGATCPITVEAKPLAQTLSHELANIVSGIEGGAFRLIEATPLPPVRSNAAEGLWLAIRRLRRFHDKVRAFTTTPELDETTVSVESLLMSLRDELEASELGLQMTWNLPRTLPVPRGDNDALLAGLMFLSMALQQLAQGALRLSIDVEVSFVDDQPHVQLELRLEWDEDPGRHPLPSPISTAFLVARTSARNLLRSQGCSFSIDHVPGHLARALVRMPATYTSTSPMRPMLDSPVMPPAADSPLPMLDRNRFGGVLVLESDPTVRTMLASELKACGRAVFACADGAAARSLMQATPDRFEMLVVDQATRLSASDQLATTAANLCPDLKLFVLSDGAEGELPIELAQRVHRIRKPFGISELRRALASVLDDGSDPDSKS